MESMKLGAEAAKKALMLSPLTDTSITNQVTEPDFYIVLPGLYHYSLAFTGKTWLKHQKGHLQPVLLPFRQFCKSLFCHPELLSELSCREVCLNGTSKRNVMSQLNVQIRWFSYLSAGTRLSVPIWLNFNAVTENELIRQVQNIMKNSTQNHVNQLFLRIIHPHTHTYTEKGTLHLPSNLNRRSSNPSCIYSKLNCTILYK